MPFPAGLEGMGDWHALERQNLVQTLGTDSEGLSEEEARSRLERHGPNELEEEEPIRPMAVLLHQFASPLIYILIFAAVVTLLIRDYIDAAVIVAVLVLNAVIGFTQEYKAENASRALRKMVSPQARVMRGGRVRTVPSRELVPGDVVLLESGDRIPADLRLVETHSLAVEEAALTGESVPATKASAPMPEATQLADRINMAFAGTSVTSGRGRGFVVATGAHTEIGKIATTVREEIDRKTPLQRRMDRLANLIGVAVAVSAGASLLIGVLLGESLADMFMVAVALAVAAIPEGLPVVFTITLAVGVRRMARRNAIIRKLPAVETLGSTTAIGTDKTGTLTENRMTVERLFAGGEWHAPAEPLPEDADHPMRRLLLCGVLANEAHFDRIDGAPVLEGDPTETALLSVADRMGLDPVETRRAHPQVEEIPFESERQFAGSYRREGEETVLYVKGAPERVLAMCDAAAGADFAPERLREAAREMARQGLRVLGFAYLRGAQPPPEGADAPEPSGMTFLGFQGMKDPPREGVREAIDGCRRAGIRVVMITGDHAETAQAIGRELGIAENGVPLTGQDLDSLGEGELRERVRETAVFARVTPQHKLDVVRALQANGHVVGVTGDGVNDAPALKAAEIGIAMGQEGTDVAREAADMVLTDDNFSSIYAAVEQGRITFDNLRKATFFLVSTGIAAILVILTAQILRWPLPFIPAQLLWMNLVTKGLQDVALAFEPGEPDVLGRPPRHPDEGIMSRLLWERSVVTAVVMGIGTLFLFQWALGRSGDLAYAQSVALTGMVLYQAFHLGNVRSTRSSIFRMDPFSNRFLLGAQALALGVHVLALHWGPLQFVLRTVPLDSTAWLVMLGVASTILVAIEIHKLLRRDAVN
jgi:calcium-translocating P-type ATPase